MVNPLFLDTGGIISMISHSLSSTTCKRVPQQIKMLEKIGIKWINNQLFTLAPLITCKTAYIELLRIIQYHAGREEIGRWNELRKIIKIIPDQPSKDIMELKSSRTIKKNDQMIFGTARKLGLQIITTDNAFVKATKYHGVELDAIILHSFPLTGL